MYQSVLKGLINLKNSYLQGAIVKTELHALYYLFPRTSGDVVVILIMMNLYQNEKNGCQYLLCAYLFYTTFTNLSTNYLVMCKVYIYVGGIK